MGTITPLTLNPTTMSTDTVAGNKIVYLIPDGSCDTYKAHLLTEIEGQVVYKFWSKLKQRWFYRIVSKMMFDFQVEQAKKFYNTQNIDNGK